MAINSIILQPAINSLNAAYRPIIFSVRAANISVNRHNVTISNSGHRATISPVPAQSIYTGTYIVFTGALSGSVTVTTFNDIGAAIIVDFPGFVLPIGSYTNVALAVNSVAATFVGPPPPVVYCDIYFNSVFYKTISKTQYISLQSTYSDWQFDIQDACQEIFSKTIGSFGGSSIFKQDDQLPVVYCKFRSSNFDTDGFIVTEDTAPIQGTSTSAPVSGTGTQSNSSYVLNTTLQHENNQDLGSHLGYFKNGVWQNVAFPLSHRLNKYLLGIDSNDYFPLAYTGANAMECIKLSYKRKTDTSFQTLQNCSVVITDNSGGGGVGGGGGGGGSVCVAASIGGGQVLPDAQVGVAYSATLNLSGTAPFSITAIEKPTWMTVSLSGTVISFTGTPVSGNVTVSFIINNCDNSLSLYYFIFVL